MKRISLGLGQLALLRDMLNRLILYEFAYPMNQPTAKYIHLT